MNITQIKQTTSDNQQTLTKQQHSTPHITYIAQSKAILCRFADVFNAVMEGK